MWSPSAWLYYEVRMSAVSPLRWLSMSINACVARVWVSCTLKTRLGGDPSNRWAESTHVLNRHCIGHSVLYIVTSLMAFNMVSRFSPTTWGIITQSGFQCIYFSKVSLQNFKSIWAKLKYSHFNKSTFYRYWISRADKKNEEEPKKGRILWTKRRKFVLDILDNGPLLYGPGIDDSVWVEKKNKTFHLNIFSKL